MRLYDGTEDRNDLAEIGVSDVEYWQGMVCDDCGVEECICDTLAFEQATADAIAAMIEFQESFDLQDAKARAKRGKDRWQA